MAAEAAAVGATADDGATAIAAATDSATSSVVTAHGGASRVTHLPAPPDPSKARNAREAYTTPSTITDQILLGSYRQSVAYTRLKDEWGVTRLLCVKDSARFPPDSFKFKFVPLSDMGDTDLVDTESDKLEEAVEFLRETEAAGERVLVHCSMGVNRSPTIVVAHLMRSHGWSLKRAYTHVTACRSLASPHEKYFEQLQRLEVKWHSPPGGGAPTLTREDIGPSLQDMMRAAAAEEADKTGSSSAPASEAYRPGTIEADSGGGASGSGGGGGGCAGAAAGGGALVEGSGDGHDPSP